MSALDADREPPAAPDRSGQVLGGRYRLQRRLAAGGMGEVYSAKHTEIPRFFAIKLMHPEFVRDERLLARFKREAHAAAGLVSEHVVAIADFGYAPDGSPFIAMELLDGLDLRRCMNAQPLSISQSVQIIMQVCSGIAVAHQQGIVHRDLKPENLFLARVAERTLVKVLDFGIAKSSDQTLGTGPGRIIGTPQYMAPEQVRSGSKVDERSDVYALGVILYELLTGEVAHPGSSVHELLTHILFEDPAPLRERNGAVPEALAAIVHKACAREPSARFATAESLRSALVAFGGGDALPALDVCSEQTGAHDTVLAHDSESEAASLPAALQTTQSALRTSERMASRSGQRRVIAAIILAGVLVTAFQAWRAASEHAPARTRAAAQPTPMPPSGAQLKAAAAMPAAAGSVAPGPPLQAPSEPEPLAPPLTAAAEPPPPVTASVPVSKRPRPNLRPAPPTETPAPQPTESAIIEVQRGDDTILFKRQNPLRRE